jgi:hypothetical protein
MLSDEVSAAQRLVRTDALQMSLGEIVTMYRDKELVVNPNFQRLFRWEISQKSKLIESILNSRTERGSLSTDFKEFRPFSNSWGFWKMSMGSRNRHLCS